MNQVVLRRDYEDGVNLAGVKRGASHKFSMYIEGIMEHSDC